MLNFKVNRGSFKWKLHLKLNGNTGIKRLGSWFGCKVRIAKEMGYLYSFSESMLGCVGGRRTPS